MKNLFKFLLNQRLRQRKQRNKNWGFTLIELLVAVLIAGIIISSLLGFMVDILTSDRREQARAISEQEIQAAMDYIARDLEQAVYIYDADGLYGTGTNGVTTNPIINQLPDTPGNINPDANVDRTPVLVFWKRTVLPSNLTVPVGNTDVQVGDLVTLPGGGTDERDYLVYSLVTYYLSRDIDSRCSATSSVNLTWACTNRIERWEIRDGIPMQGATARDGTRQEIDPANPTVTPTTASYDLQPSQGFVRFSLKSTGDNLMQKMNRWKRNEPPQPAYNLQRDQITTLIDFVDQSPFLATTTDRNSPPQPVDCRTAIRNVNTTANPNAYLPQQVPNYTSITSAPTALRNGSFYACVDSEQTVAQVYIRGNALARTVDNRTIRNSDRALYRESRAAFFPTASIQVKGRGLLNLEQQ